MLDFNYNDLNEKMIFSCGECCENCEHYFNCHLTDNSEPCRLWEKDDDNFFYCCNCGKLESYDNGIYCEDSGNYYCNDCYENGEVEIHYCEDCGNYFEYSYNQHYIEGGDYYICDDCLCNGEYCYCKSCDTYREGYSNTVYDEDGNEHQYCEGCLESYCNYCDDCDIYYIGDYCPNCEMERRKVIKNYSYKPEPVFFGDCENNIVYGIELETENNPIDFATDLMNDDTINHHIYCKHDGSLSDGVEIVSHPADKNSLQEVYKKVMEIALNNGCVSWNNSNCGLHFHISRESLRNIYDNIPEWEIILTYVFSRYQTELEKISGRKSFHYCEYYSYGSFKETIGNQRYFNDTRYKAVNTCNYATIEIRTFKGTLNFEAFKNRFNILEGVIKACGDLLNKYEIFESIENYFDNHSFIDLINNYVDDSTLNFAVNEINNRKLKNCED